MPVDSNTYDLDELIERLRQRLWDELSCPESISDRVDNSEVIDDRVFSDHTQADLLWNIDPQIFTQFNQITMDDSISSTNLYFENPRGHNDVWRWIQESEERYTPSFFE